MSQSKESLIIPPRSELRQEMKECIAFIRAAATLSVRLKGMDMLSNVLDKYDEREERESKAIEAIWALSCDKEALDDG